MFDMSIVVNYVHLDMSTLKCKYIHIFYRQQIKDEKSVSSFKRYPSNLGAVERYNFER